MINLLAGIILLIAAVVGRALTYKAPKCETLFDLIGVA